MVMRMMMFFFVLWIGTTAAVDKSKFRTCQSTGFCKRYREHQPASHFHVDVTTLDKSNPHKASATLVGGPSGSVPLNLNVHFYKSGVARVRITEAKTRWQPPDVILEDQLDPSTYSYNQNDGHITFTYDKESEQKKAVRLGFNPFRVDLYVNDVSVMTLNSKNLFHFEHTRRKDGTVVTDDMVGQQTVAAPKAGDVVNEVPEGKKIVDYNEHGHAIYDDGSTSADAADAADAQKDVPPPPDVNEAEPSEGSWEESFGGHTDTKPNGPQSVGMDITFNNVEHVFGIPEHASKFSLKPTDNSVSGAYNEPYRLYNLDVFEYDLDVPMALYGAIPLMVGHNKDMSIAAFWFNPTETFIDVKKVPGTNGATNTESHWISESGLPDIFLLPGPNVNDLYRQYAQMTGTSQLPPLFSLGYHQCRWNYRDEADVRAVDAKFEEHNFPYDVIWLDIEHTNGKRYFTWDSNLFPDSIKLIDDIASKGRKVVTIVDPHLKRDGSYSVHTEAQAAGVYVQNKDGGEFDGWCWPGSSSYVDFTNPKARSWWADRFKLENYKGSTMDLFTWNDMNEPSVFNGPEVTMKKDTKAIDGQESREWHNLYGFYMQMATNEGQIRRKEDRSERPFLLSRSFFAGSQRYGAIWTGDNAGKWDHLEIAMPMLLSFNVAGLPFIGSDTGGFFGNPNEELMTRWFQASAFHPFFRAHAHHDAKRREPYVFGEPHTSRLRSSVVTRYQHLPLWYTLFHHAHTNGMPVMRALWMEFPKEEKFFGVDNVFMVGNSLLVKPITSPGVTSTSMDFPGGETQRWYDTISHVEYTGGTTVTVSAPIDFIPVYQRGGTIVPKQMRVRRSSQLMVNDPYTLVVALDSTGSAKGDIYLDDFHSFEYQTSKAYIHREFSVVQKVGEGKGTVMTSKDLTGGVSNSNFQPTNTVERIVFMGLKNAPTKVTIHSDSTSGDVEFIFDQAASTLTLRKPNVLIRENWSIILV